MKTGKIPALYAVDFGTTHIKAAAFDQNGNQLALCQESTPMVADSDGGHCIDPAGAAGMVMRNLAAVAAQVAPEYDPVGIGIASMAEAFVAVDADCHPLRPIMVWLDMRQGKKTSSFLEQLGGWEYYQLTGLVRHPKYSIGKINWIQENEPEIFRAASRWLTMDCFVANLLTGTYATEPTIAQRTGCFNLSAGEWDNFILGELGLEPDCFPEIKRSGALVGSLTGCAAGMTGLPAGLPVYLGGHDHLCAAHGAGVIQPGQTFVSMGTAEAAVRLTETLAIKRLLFDVGMTAHPFLGDEAYCFMGALQSSGGSFEWFAKTIFGCSGQESYVKASALQPTAVPGSILYLPHLKGSTAPHMDQNSRACFIGIGMDTTPADLLQAVYEGVSFEQRLILELMERAGGSSIDILTVSGGATQNPVWMRIKASALNRTLFLCRTSQTALLGAAMRAGIGAGLYSDSRDAVARAGAAINQLPPEPLLSQHYDAVFNTSYRELYQSVRRHFASMWEKT